MTKIGIVGGRNFNNYELLKNTILEYLKCPHCKIVHIDEFYKTTIVSGGARGADNLAEQFANDYWCELIVHPAEWEKYGKQAGFLRNIDIVKDSDIIFAFWDGKSKGTKHSIDLANKMGKEIRIINY